MAMVWPVPSERQRVDAVGGPDLGRACRRRSPMGESSVTVLATPLPLIGQRIDDQGRVELGVAALGRAGPPARRSCRSSPRRCR